MLLALLAEVFITFRKSTIDKYKLDLCWSACLKLTKIKLELLTDSDMSMFIDMSFIGGFIGVTSSEAYFNSEFCVKQTIRIYTI